MPRFLFLDNEIIAQQKNLTRRAHQAVRHPANPVMVREYPWEKRRAQIYGHSVIYDSAAHKFRLYYLAQAQDEHYPPVLINGAPKNGVATLPAYAESDDGIHWVKPALGQCSFNGIEPTNLLDFNRGMSFEPGVLYDPHDPDAGRRYKLFYWDQQNLVMPEGTLHYENWGYDCVVKVEDTAGEVIWRGHYNDWGIDVAFSPDGIHWTRHADGPVWRCYSDTGQSVLFDEKLGKYVAFGRFNLTRLHNGHLFNVGRSVARVESDDFLHWSEPELVLAADDRDPDGLQINSMPVSFYEGLYIGLMELFVPPTKVHAGNLQLAMSHDGRHWKRVCDRFNFLEPGTGVDWDNGGGIRPGSGLIVHDDRVMMYYCGGRRVAESVGLATWRRDGFVSLHAGPDGGELLSTACICTGSQLHLNLDAADGEVTVQVCNHQGQPQPDWAVSTASAPLRGDSTDIIVNWPDSNLATLIGQPITLRFRLRNVDLYSFWFSELLG